MSNVVEINPDVLSGAPVFKGTRVSIVSLFDYLEGGDSIEDFMSDFPSVSKKQIIHFLEDLKSDAVKAA